MALSTYDLISLAAKYDRIMNSARRVECAQDASRRSNQQEILKSIIALISKIVAAYNMPFYVDIAHNDQLRGNAHSNSLAAHLSPGQTKWTGRGSDDAHAANIDDKSGDTFFSFIMNLATKVEPAIMEDKRTNPATRQLCT